MNIKERVKLVKPEMIELRRDVHKNPELPMQEFRTTKVIAEKLDELGVSFRLLDPTGIIGEIRGTKGESDHCVVLRADIDALPMPEETGLPFASVNPGVMHACGHDTHLAMLFGAVKVLNECRDQFSGTVRFVFQPAEETSQGAPLVISQGACDGADIAMALHNYTLWETGVFYTRRGGHAASADRFTITVTGKGAHGAGPNQGIDPIPCAAEIISALQSIVAREYDPMDTCVISVCQVHAGTRFNIIPDTVVMDGTARAFTREVWTAIPESMDRIIQGVAAAYRCKAELKYERLCLPVINDDWAYDIMQKTLKKITDSPEKMQEAPITMGGEDFAAFGDKVPIVWVQLGSGLSAPMHTTKMSPNEDVLVEGAACYAQFAVDALEELNG